jgi:hypothetical protein
LFSQTQPSYTTLVPVDETSVPPLYTSVGLQAGTPLHPPVLIHAAALVLAAGAEDEVDVEV